MVGSNESVETLDDAAMTPQRKTARHLRGSQTDAEKFVWNQLRGRRLAGYKFRRQVAIGPYIADFVCFEEKLVVELDGTPHAEPEQKAHDALRTRWLERQGFRVVRFHNEQTEEGWRAVQKAILAALRAPSPPAPLPRRGEGRQEPSPAPLPAE